MVIFNSYVKLPEGNQYWNLWSWGIHIEPGISSEAAGAGAGARAETNAWRFDVNEIKKWPILQHGAKNDQRKFRGRNFRVTDF